MSIRHMAAATAVAASLGLGMAAAQTAQQVNPSPMPPGSRAEQAPGMRSDGAGNNSPGTTAQQVNPSPMPPGSRADQARGMNPQDRVAQDRGTVGGTGALAPSGQPDVQRGTAPRDGGFGATPGSAGASPGLAQGGTSGTPGVAPGSQPGTSGTGTGVPMAQPRPVPGVGAEGGTRESPGMTGSAGAAPGGSATGTTTPGTTTQGGGRSDASPPAATTRHTEPRTAAAPVAGANSFTEGQARARMGDAGFNDVQDLRLDDQGIWRGRAMRGGQQTGVALDYQGNVVATQ
ncbi:hypothetical protein [Falsiroseomonas sp. CW058]|uniref:hypothetical protein n=1 Tax=Falsiroseomonas sp. CW058 TaxID=3388664 RepID=UPI003D31D958